MKGWVCLMTSEMSGISFPALFLWVSALLAEYDPSVALFLPMMVRCFGLSYQMEY